MTIPDDTDPAIPVDLVTTAEPKWTLSPEAAEAVAKATRASDHLDHLKSMSRSDQKLLFESIIPVESGKADAATEAVGQLAATFRLIDGLADGSALLRAMPTADTHH